MVLDAATRRNLELTETLRDGQVKGSLLSVLDHTVTPMGKRLIRQWVSKPLLDLDAIQGRQEAVGHLVEQGMLRAELRAGLRPLADLERLINRVICAARRAARPDRDARHAAQPAGLARAVPARGRAAGATSWRDCTSAASSWLCWRRPWPTSRRPHWRTPA